MEIKKSPYTAKLVDISKESSASLNYRVRRYICEALEHGYPIDISNVSARTGIARQTLYHDPEIRSLIEYYKQYCQYNLYSYKGESEKDAKKREERFRFLADMPSLQGMEPVMDELIEENHKLNMQYMELQTKLFALESGIEIED